MGYSKTKVAIAGCGTVGSTLAFNLAQCNVCDEIMLIDINRKKAWADASDIGQALAFSPYRMKITEGDYSMCSDVDIVVLALSAAYSGTNREDMIGSTGTVVSTVIPEVMQSGFDGIFVVITNPVDTVTFMVNKLSGLPAGRVIGTGTSLDSARLRQCIAEYLSEDVRSVDAFFLGEHGPSQFVPWSAVRVAGRRATEILTESECRMLEEKAIGCKADIASVKGAAVFGIVSVTTQIVRAVLRDENKLMPVSVMLSGQYGLSSVCMGVPGYIGRSGAGNVLEYPLTEAENFKLGVTSSELKRSVSKIRHLIPTF